MGAISHHSWSSLNPSQDLKRIVTLGQARFLTKLDQKGIRGEKVKAAWIEKMKEVLNKMIKQAF